MEIIQDYTPSQITFNVKQGEVPAYLGNFDSIDDVKQFVNKNFVAIPKQIEAERHLDDYEKSHIRNEYIVEIEENYPQYQEILILTTQALEQAKEAEKRAKETLSASFNKIDALAKEVKKGIAEINLDQATTYEIALNGKYHYYTDVNSELVLAKTIQIPENDLNDLFVSSEKNKAYFERFELNQVG